MTPITNDGDDDNDDYEDGDDVNGDDDDDKELHQSREYESKSQCPISIFNVFLDLASWSARAKRQALTSPLWHRTGPRRHSL